MKDLLIETVQRAQVAALDARGAIERLELQLVTLRRTVFGVRSERIAGQADLFDEKVALPLPPENNLTITYERRHRGGGRPALPENLPRVRIEYELSEVERAQFARVQPIGEETSETLEFTPARLVVLEHARLKYRCEDFEGASTVRTATAHPSPLPRSNAGPGLLAHVLVSKYGDGLPLARQERIFTRHGAVLSRKTLCDWVLAACELLGRLRAPLHQHILGAPVVFSDDTTLKLRTEEVRGRSVTARLWGYVSAGWQRNESDARVDLPQGGALRVHRGSARRASAALSRPLPRLPAGRRLRGLPRVVPQQARLSRCMLGACPERVFRHRAQGRNARTGTTGAGLDPADLPRRARDSRASARRTTTRASATHPAAAGSVPAVAHRHRARSVAPRADGDRRALRALELARAAAFHPRRNARGRLQPRRALHAPGRGGSEGLAFCGIEARGARRPQRP
ncbi:MAG: transposase [Burkholderiaceae bacterium]|nr:transposase [Burkholderiaceae bacterium]